jgi:membrane-associated phospholipid phosphatase
VDIVGIVIMKLAFKRSRPPHHKTDGRFVGADQHSFPSGHATRAWCTNGLIFSLSSGIVLFFHTVSLFYVLSNLTGGICIAYPSIIKEFFGIPISTVQPLFGIWACLICFGRIALGRHYPSDVLAGSLIGYFIEYPLTALILNGWVFPK